MSKRWVFIASFGSAAVLVTAISFFMIGMYSTLKRNALYNAAIIAKNTIEDVQSKKPDKAKSVQTIALDFSTGDLIDTTLLPLRKSVVRLGNPSGGSVAPVAVFDGFGDVMILQANGDLLAWSPGCKDKDCLRRVATLDLEAGRGPTDLYDAVPALSDGTMTLYVSHGRTYRTSNEKSFAIKAFTMPTPGSASGPIKPARRLFESDRFSLVNDHAPLLAGGEMVLERRRNSLVVTIGDFGLNGVSNRYQGPVAPPQSMDSYLGKVVRIDLASGKAAIISSGHRNPQGLAISPSGELLATEHGPKGGDEVNRILEGHNYGWPLVSMGANYKRYVFAGTPAVDTEVHGGYTPPITAFLPSIGISQIVFVENFHEAWNGDVLIGSLKAQNLYRMRRWDGGHYIEQIHVGGRVRDLAIISGALYLITDDARLMRLDPVEDVERLTTVTGLADQQGPLVQCGQCHNLSAPTSTEFAPHLKNIFGREIASLDDFGRYSTGLRTQRGEVWTADRLRAYLRNPPAAIPGTTMPRLELSDVDVDRVLTELSLLR